MKRFIKEKWNTGVGLLTFHYSIIIIGVLLALLVLSPVIAFPSFAGSRYQGINISHFGTDAHFYLSRAKDALEGHRLGAAVLREGKDNQDLYFMYNERALVSPFRLLGLESMNVVTLYNTYIFIGVFLLALLIYILTFQLSRRRMLSLVVTIFVIAGYHIVYRQFLYTDANQYARPMFPLISSLAFFLYLNFLTAWLSTKATRYRILASLSFGLLFYVYVFAWTFALALLGSLTLVYAFRRKVAEVKGLLVIAGIGILIGAYNLFLMLSATQSSSGAQIEYFHWAYHMRTPIFSKLGGALLLFTTFFAYRRRHERFLPLLVSIPIAIFVALNQQIITGQVVQIGHYYWYFFVPLSIISVLYMCWILLEGHIVWRKYIFVAIVVVVGVHGTIGQYRSFFVPLPEKLYEQTYRPFIDALKTDKKAGVILAAGDSLSYLFTIYTDHDLFWAPSATQTLTPLSRFKDTLFIYMYLNRESRNDFPWYIERFMKDATDASIYKDLYMNIEGYTSGLDFYKYQAVVNDGTVMHEKRRALITSLSSDYEMLVKDNHKGINELLSKYGVNYIVLDTNRYPEWDLSFIPDLHEVAVNNGVYLYRLKGARGM